MLDGCPCCSSPPESILVKRCTRAALVRFNGRNPGMGSTPIRQNNHDVSLVFTVRLFLFRREWERHAKVKVVNYDIIL